MGVENLVNTLVMLGRSRLLVCFFVLNTAASALFNLCGILVSEYLTSVHRLLAMQTCALVVWVVSLAVYYLSDTRSAIAEAWSLYSFLTLAGFAIFVSGQLVYGEIVILPVFHYPVLDCERPNDEIRQVETVSVSAEEVNLQ